MSIPPTNRLAGAALVTGGLAWSLSYWLRDAAGDATSGGLVAAAIVTGVLGVVTVMLGLPGWYAAQADRARWAGLVAFVLVFTALPILEIGSLVFAAAQPGLGLGPAPTSAWSSSGSSPGGPRCSPARPRRWWRSARS